MTFSERRAVEFQKLALKLLTELFGTTDFEYQIMRSTSKECVILTLQKSLADNMLLLELHRVYSRGLFKPVAYLECAQAFHIGNSKEMLSGIAFLIRTFYSEADLGYSKDES